MSATKHLKRWWKPAAWGAWTVFMAVLAWQLGTYWAFAVMIVVGCAMTGATAVRAYRSRA